LSGETAVLLSFPYDSMRWHQGGTADATTRAARIKIGLIVLSLLPGFAGCATFPRRGPSSEKAAACRELTGQGVAAMQLGQWQQAETLLRQALEASPDDAETRRNLAEALWHQGTVHEAMSHIAAAMRLKPGDATIAVRAGEMALAAGARDAALVHAEQAIRLDPQLPSAWALRGRIFRQMDQPDRAIADLQRALEFAPQNADVLLDLAVMYRERGQAARCLTTLHHLHDSYPTGEVPQTALLLEGMTLLELERPNQAADVFLAAAQRGPPQADSLFYLAQAQSAAGRYAEATASVQQALAIDASHQASQQLLAQLAPHVAPAGPQRR
jgi:tetratricopeptide (TPR) repeat protein